MRRNFSWSRISMALLHSAGSMWVSHLDIQTGLVFSWEEKGCRKMSWWRRIYWREIAWSWQHLFSWISLSSAVSVTIHTAGEIQAFFKFRYLPKASVPLEIRCWAWSSCFMQLKSEHCSLPHRAPAVSAWTLQWCVPVGAQLFADSCVLLCCGMCQLQIPPLALVLPCCLSPQSLWQSDRCQAKRLVLLSNLSKAAAASKVLTNKCLLDVPDMCRVSASSVNSSVIVL